MEDGEAGFGGGRIAEAEGALPEARFGVTVELQGMALGEHCGIRREIRETLCFKLGAIEYPERTVTSGLDVTHQFQVEPPHCVAGVDFDDGFEAAGAVGQTVDEGVDAQRTDISEGGEAQVERGDEIREATVKFQRQVDRASRIAEQFDDARRRAQGVIRRGPVGDELSPGIVDECGVTEDLKARGVTFQLDGKIKLTFQPRFHNERVSLPESVGHPLPLGFEDLGFPKPDGVGAGETKGFLDYDAVVSAGPDLRHGFEGGIDRQNRDADDLGRTEPRRCGSLIHRPMGSRGCTRG